MLESFFLKKRLQHKCFHVNIFKNTFSYRTPRSTASVSVRLHSPNEAQFSFQSCSPYNKIWADEKCTFVCQSFRKRIHYYSIIIHLTTSWYLQLLSAIKTGELFSSACIKMHHLLEKQISSISKKTKSYGGMREVKVKNYMLLVNFILSCYLKFLIIHDT